MLSRRTEGSIGESKFTGQPRGRRPAGARGPKSQDLQRLLAQQTQMKDRIDQIYLRGAPI